MPLRILVNGAGVCGLAVVTFLIRSNPDHQIHVVERTGSLRTGGHQIDLRAQGIPIAKILGLLETIRSKTVPEDSVIFLDSDGKERAVFGVNNSGQGQQSFVSEYEIMRGDLVQVLYDATLREAESKIHPDIGSLRYEFGKYATEVVNDNNVVSVTFSDGSMGEYDLVIGADGQSSRTRRIIFENHTKATNPFKSLNLYVGYFLIPKSAEDAKENVAKAYHIPGRKLIGLRTGAARTQIMLTAYGDSKELRESTKLPVEQQKELFERLFRGSGWETERFLQSLKTVDDFYVQPVGQVKLEKWSKGRVVLLGDAGYCASPLSALGTTLSLVGAYVLAGELSKHGDNVLSGLSSYEKVLRPFVNESQKLPAGVPGIAFPQTRWGIACIHFILGLISTLKLESLLRRLMPKDGSWKIPEYPELYNQVESSVRI